MNEVLLFFNSGDEELFAAIGAKYPEGFTCTCTGKNSGKVLTAKKSPWIFRIPEADEWTVAATGGNNPSKTVNITHEGQVEKVDLRSLVLVEDGNEIGDWTSLNAVVTNEGGYLKVWDDEEYPPGDFYYYTSADLSNFSKLIVDGLNGGTAARANALVGVGASFSIPSKTEILTTARSTVEIDVSDMTGVYIISLQGKSVMYDDDLGLQDIAAPYIYNMRLE